MKFRLLLAVCLLLTVVSCSKITVLRTRELIEVQNRVDSLRNDIFVIEEAWQAKHESELRDEESFRIAIELVLGRINEMITRLAGNLAESQARISEIDRKAGLISSYMTERARQDSLDAFVKEQERIGLFNLAKKNYDSGNYNAAITDFSDYIEKYSGTEEAKDALYWIAESRFALNLPDEAESTFKRYYSENREGRLACAALYKLGLIYDKQQKSRSRDTVWGQLNRQCPDSEEAKLVKENQKR